MINSGREWDWMDDTHIEKALVGWGFELDRLRESEGGAASSLDRRSPRAFSTKVSNDLPNQEGIPAQEWCYYAGMPSPNAYTE